MMWLIIVPGIISTLFGIIFLIAPKQLMSEERPRGRQLIDVDSLCLEHRICAGLCLIAIGVFCLLSALYVWFRLST